VLVDTIMMSAYFYYHSHLCLCSVTMNNRVWCPLLVPMTSHGAKV